MPIEKSAGAIIFRKEGNETYYLLLHCPSGPKAPRDDWDFCKGHIEEGEKPEDTVKREVKEETGLIDIKFIRGFKETIKYFFRWEGKNILKFVTFYLVETKTKEIEISGEHIGYGWLTCEEALKQLTFKNARQILQKANNFLSKEGL